MLCGSISFQLLRAEPPSDVPASADELPEAQRNEVSSARTASPLIHFPTSYLNDPRIDQAINEVVESNEALIRGSFTNQVNIPKAVRVDPLWWEGRSRALIGKGPARKITLEEIYIRAITYSTQIKVFSDIPLIRETSIQEARGEFNTRAFVETTYDSINDPVANLLETGRPDGRFVQDEFTNEAGLRKKLSTGAEVSLSQEVGTLTNNSEFLVPDPQGNARLKLSIRQPLLQGAGVPYNTAVLDIARLDTTNAYAEHVRQAESHLLEVTRAYWSLYLSRVQLLQRIRYFREAEDIAKMLEARSAIDAVSSQIGRANSAVAFRRSQLVRAEKEVANAQDRLRSLINDPSLGTADTVELIPIDPLMTQATPIDYVGVSTRALEQRAEVVQGVQNIRAAAVREKKARNEILPDLELIFEGYVAGLSGNNAVGSAWTRQFDRGSPGFLVGISLDWPLENDAAKARLTRRQIELRQQFNQLRTTIDTVLLEAKVSAREVETAWRDYVAKAEAVRAAQEDLDQLVARRELETTAPAGGRPFAPGTASFYLEEWLDSQNRLELAENQLAEAATIYQVALVNLDRAQGNLLEVENISVVRTTDPDGLPLLELRKNPTQRRMKNVVTPKN